MVRPILRYGAHALTTSAREVEEISEDTRSLVTDMVETMYAAKGIGLAAPQLGVSQRIFVVDLSAGQRPWELQTFINPVVLSREGMQLAEEGCLSVPGFSATVARPERLVVRAADVEGRVRTVEAAGLMARAFQHELDHLEGRLFVKRLKTLQRRWIDTLIDRRARAGRW